jgi:hypothetical protein
MITLDGAATVPGGIAGYWIYRWLYIDFFVPVWPNLAASFVLWLLVRAEHVKTRKAIK